MESVSYIQLETEENSLIGTITNIYVSTDRIYVLDMIKTKSLFIFDMSGKFINRVCRLGNGPGEYRYVMDFVVNEKRDEIILLVDGNKIIITDLQGKFIRDHTLKKNHYSYLFSLDDSFHVLGCHPASDPDCLISMTDMNFDVVKEYCPGSKNQTNMRMNSEVNYSGHGSNYLFASPLSSIIYQISKEECVPLYEFKVDDELRLTEEKLEKHEDIASSQYYEEMSRLFSLSGYFELRKNLFVTFRLEKKEYWGVYNPETNIFKYVLREKLKHGENPLDKSICFMSQIDDRTIAGYVDFDLLSEKDIIENGLDPELNPMIVICKMKDE
jgi:hypothetical protein